MHPIKTDKHEVTWSDLATSYASNTTKSLIIGVDSADKDSSTECEVGSHVHSIYVEFNLSAATTGNPNIFHWKIYGRPTGMTVTNANTYYQDDRSVILKRGMEMVPANVNTIIKRIFVVRIPKKFQRIAKNFNLIVSGITSGSDTINWCGIVIYKEIY